jgi:hypothetical protein
MRTNWQYHRPHIIANLAFRALALTGFALGLVVAITRDAPDAPSCDIEHAECIAQLIRHEALIHLAPPVAGLVAGLLLGAWLARGVHSMYSRART